MRIRKRLSGCFPKQLPSIKYCYSTGWLRPKHEQADGTTSRAGAGLTGYTATHTRLGRHCSRQHDSAEECKCEDEEAIEEKAEAIGEEPRTPPPGYGEKKPAVILLPRFQQEGPAAAQLDCRCRRRSKKNKRRSQRDPVNGESSAPRKRLRDHHHQHHLQLSVCCHVCVWVAQDTAEAASERSSQDKCGPHPSLRPDIITNDPTLGDKSASYQQEINRMDPLLRAMHTVVSEAGIEGLTARETAQRIVSRGLCREADIPRSVKMAKTMRDSPYLVEITRNSKFVLWSTFLEESSKTLEGQTTSSTTTTAAIFTAAGSHPPYKRRRRQRPVNSSFTAAPRTEPGNIQTASDHRHHFTAAAYQVNHQLTMVGVGASPEASKIEGLEKPRKFLLDFDLNSAPQEDDGW